MIPPRLLLPLLTFTLAGCAGGAIDAPSLATRAVEKDAVPLPDEAREPASALDPALTVKLRALLAQANAAQAAFAMLQAKAAAAVTRAAGAPAGSESWTTAQQALSLLDTARGPLQGTEADVAALRADPANATPANRAAIDMLAAQVQALGDQENAAVTMLGGKLKS